MLARVASRRLATASLARPGLLAPASALARRVPLGDDRRATSSPVRDLSSKAALSKMGTLSVDPLASSPAVQSVEYVLTGFDKLVNWARKSSMWPMTFGLA